MSIAHKLSTIPSPEKSIQMLLLILGKNFGLNKNPKSHEHKDWIHVDEKITSKPSYTPFLQALPRNHVAKIDYKLNNASGFMQVLISKEANEIWKQLPTINKQMYRYQDTCFYTDEYTSQINIEVITFDVIKETPKGVWIGGTWGYYPNYQRKKFVNLEARKKFACETKEEALISFIARKNAQIGILKNQLNRTEEAYKKGTILLLNKRKTNELSKNCI